MYLGTCQEITFLLDLIWPTNDQSLDQIGKLLSVSHYRSRAIRRAEVKTAPKKSWLERDLQRRASVCWFNRSWENLWTRRSRCPTGRNVHCASAKLDMQVSCFTCTDAQWQRQMVAGIFIKDYHVLFFQTLTTHKSVYFPNILIFSASLVSSGRCLLFAGGVHCSFQQCCAVWVTSGPAQHVFKSFRQKRRWCAEGETVQAEEAVSRQRGWSLLNVVK